MFFLWYGDGKYIAFRQSCLNLNREKIKYVANSLIAKFSKRIKEKFYIFSS